MRNLSLKRGSAFIIDLVATNADGTAFDLTSVTLSGQIRDPRSNLIDDMNFVLGTVSGTANVTIANTEGWPEDLLQADILITDGTLATHSETFGIEVREPVTASLPAPADYNPVTS